MNTRIRFFVGPLSLALLISPASALEYHYTADLYPNHFYTSTSSNRALDMIVQITPVEPLSPSRQTA